LVLQAKEINAALLMLPEYAGIEIACKYHDADLNLYQSIQPLISQYKEFYSNLARQYQIYIQPGSIIEEITPDTYCNRAYFFGPSGGIGYQDKLCLVEFEKIGQFIKPGKTQSIFNTALGKIGIAICYDSEFPEIVRSLTKAGATLILVPSYNNSLASYHRVLFSCRARAIENQCYLAMSCVVGQVKIDLPENTYGKAAIVGPIEDGFSNDGIMTEGTLNQQMMVVGSISFEKLNTIRAQGQTHNFEDSQSLGSFILDECSI
jgi:predicted amidohydrolase